MTAGITGQDWVSIKILLKKVLKNFADNLNQLTWLPLFFIFSYFMAMLRPFIPDLTLTTENASESHIHIRKIKDSIKPGQGGKKVYFSKK